MTHHRSRMSVPAPQAGPLCKRFGPMLPLVFQEDLLDDEAPETEALREHLADCAYCRTMLALYRTQEDSLRRSFAARVAASPHYANAIIERLEEEPIMSQLPEHSTPEQVSSTLQTRSIGTDTVDFAQRRLEAAQLAMRPPKRRVHPAVAWLLPLAAVLLIALLARTLFTTLRSSSTVAGGPPSFAPLSSIHLVNGSQLTFSGVSMLSATEGWAIASPLLCDSTGCATGADLLLRDHAGVWSVVTFPDLYDQYGNHSPLFGISAVSSTDVWIAAGAYLLHYDGQHWTRQRFGSYQIWSVKMFSATNGWVRAIHLDLPPNNPINTLFHYDGHSWTAVPRLASQNCSLPSNLPSDPGAFEALAPLSDGEVWAIGFCDVTQDANATAPVANIILHYDGHNWSVAQLPTLGADFQLDAIAMLSPQEGWAIGNEGQSGVAPNIFLLHYTQGTWQRVPTPPAFAQLSLEGANTVTAFSMVSSTEGWLVVSSPVVSNNAVETAQPDPVFHDVQGVWTRVTLPMFSSSNVKPKGWELQWATSLPSGEGWIYGYINKVITPTGQHPIAVIVPLLLHYANGRWNVVLD